MSEFPGLLPWHFGGDEALTWEETHGIHDVYMERQEERRKQNKGK